MIRTGGGELYPRLVTATGDRELDFDLVLAGDCALLGEDAIKEVAAALFQLAGADSVVGFDIQPVDKSWLILQGTADLGLGDRQCFQLTPHDPQHSTIDVPNMQSPFDPLARPEWACVAGPDYWQFSFPRGLTVVSDVHALHGLPVTEVARWADGEIQMHAIQDNGHQPVGSDLRVVPLATLAAFDPSLAELAETPRGCSWWRANGASDWHQWNGWPAPTNGELN